MYQLLMDQNMTQLEEKKKRAAAYIETLIKTAYLMIRKRWALSDNLSEMIDFLGNDLRMSQITHHLEVNPSL